MNRSRYTGSPPEAEFANDHADCGCGATFLSLYRSGNWVGPLQGTRPTLDANQQPTAPGDFCSFNWGSANEGRTCTTTVPPTTTTTTVAPDVALANCPCDTTVLSEAMWNMLGGTSKKVEWCASNGSIDYNGHKCPASRRGLLLPEGAGSDPVPAASRELEALLPAAGMEGAVRPLPAAGMEGAVRQLPATDDGCPAPESSGGSGSGSGAGTTATTTTTMPEVGTELSMVLSVDLTTMTTVLKSALGDTLAASLHETSCAPLVPGSFATLVDCYQGNGIGGATAKIQFVIDSALGLSAMPTYPYTRRLSEEELKLFEGDMFFSAVG